MSTDATRRQRFFARWYPRMMAEVEEAGQGDLRARHLARATGRTLDLGTGNGFSVPHYPAQVSELVMLEPNPEMRRRLQRVTRQIRAPRWEIVDGDAAALPFDDASFDTVAAGLLFCSLPDPDAALREVHRVLRPGGTFLFHEHVRGRGALGVLHRVISPVQQLVADGCHPDRDFIGSLHASPLTITEYDEMPMPGGPGRFSPMVVGVATRAA